jgi:hypothetical protein
MSSKIRILSFHHIANNGAFLFSYSLLKVLQKHFSSSDIRIIDYKSTRLALYEYLKRFKIFKGAPFFYYKRARLWDKLLKEHLDLDTDFPHFAGKRGLQEHFSDHYDAIVIGMDVWCILNGTERPLFPNIYWLPQKMEIPKLAYSVSAYHSDLSLIRYHAPRITSYLNDFDVIGSRDRFTHEMVQKHRTRSDGLIERVPDPTFLYEIRQTGVAVKLASMGVDLHRPILGLLLFGQEHLSREIQAHYHAKGYQVLAMSMFNPFADFNAGHLLDPFEWSQAFRLFSFCITDRFHGAVFCIKNQIPLIALERETGLPLAQSKLYDLLADFDLTTCYANPFDDKFNISGFLRHADEVEQAWGRVFKPKISPKIQSIQREYLEFMQKMKTLLGW